jgi:hypothetical protein
LVTALSNGDFWALSALARDPSRRNVPLRVMSDVVEIQRHAWLKKIDARYLFCKKTFAPSVAAILPNVLVGKTPKIKSENSYAPLSLQWT